MRRYNAVPPQELGEYARGVMRREDVTIKVSSASMAAAEHDIFQKINQLQLSDRKLMFANRNDIDEDCGWAWTSEYRLVKVAPGLLSPPANNQPMWPYSR